MLEQFDQAQRRTIEALRGPPGESVEGDPGSQGPQGPQGIQGPQGDVGPQGAAGAQGNQGIQGIQGATGPAGTNAPQWTFGSGAPNNANGANGDWYIRQGVNGGAPTIFLTKVAGAWTEVTRVTVAA